VIPLSHYRLVEAVCGAFPGGRPRGAVLAAVSGGSDSMALLALLAEARALSDFELTAVYVDHGLRPAAAFEAALVCATAAKVGARFEWAKCDPRSASEEALRDARYTALARTADHIGADCIATAHTRDDQIETIVFRFLRGSGRHGLAGIPGSRGNIVRPLLEIGRDELRDYLRAIGFGWAEDPSNRDLRHARNRLRHVVLPTIARELGRGRLEHLPEVARVWALEDEHLEREASRFEAYAVRRVAGEPTLDLAAFDSVPDALRARVLRRWLSNAGLEGEPGLAALARIVEIAGSREGAAEVTIEGATVVREYATLRLAFGAPAPPSFELDVRTDAVADYSDPAGAWTVSVDPQPRDVPPSVSALGFQVVEFAKEAVARPLVLRSRLPGDAIRIAERGTTKVHDIMVELRVPRRVRNSWPVLATKTGIIWVPGLAVSTDMQSASDAAAGERVRFAWRRTEL
jgi:tRNA(Ile)-lysidine synthase